MADIFDNSSLLMFRVGPVYCCAPSFPVESIIQPPEITRTPGSSTAHPGLFKHAGNMVSGLDLRYQFGVDEQNWAKPGRMIIAGVDAGVIGFWVDQIIEVMQMPQTGWGALPPLLPRGVFTRTLLFKDKIYLFAEFEKLFSIPTSGYLRTYIEHLIEIEQQAQQKSAVGQPPTLTGSNVSSNKSTSSSTGAGKTSDPKPTGQAQSKTEKSNVLPLRDKKTSNATESKPDSISAPPKTNSSTKTNQAQEKNFIPDKSDHKSSLQNATPTTSGQHQTKTIKPSLNKPENKKILNNQKTQETKTALTPNTSKTRKTSELLQPAVAKKTGIQSTSPHSKSTPKQLNTEQLSTKLQNKPFEPDTAIKSSTTTDEDESSVWPMIFILLLIVGIGSGTFWYLNQEPEKKTQFVSDTERHDQTSPASTSLTSNDVTPSADTGESTESTIASSPESEVKELTKNTTTETQEQAVANSQETVEHEPVASSSEVTSVTEATTKDYKADIVQDQDGITIILDTPDDAPVFKTSVQDEVSSEPSRAEAPTSESDEAVADSSDKADTDSIAKASTPDQVTDNVEIAIIEKVEPAVRQHMTEIIHIVKKGDTLWHIAIRYVNNPYRYPELAKLSNIKNPDLIYPGNRVRIIKRHRVKQ